jgi:hypothetical protein
VPLLGSSDVPVDHPDVPRNITPAALVILEQRVRADARDTPNCFASQQVSAAVRTRAPRRHARGMHDVLALKDADVGVAMGAGSPASRAVAQILLLDNKFATLPYVVAEGRRVIGNVERVSNLFVTRTAYPMLLALLIGICGRGLEAVAHRPAAVPVPADPRHGRGLVPDRHSGVHPVAGP